MKRATWAAVLVCVAVQARAEETIDPNAVAVPADQPTLTQLARQSPSPALLRAIADEAERGVDVAPLLAVAMNNGGGMATVDVAATKQDQGHFRRNCGKYTSAAVAAGAIYLIGDNNDWGQSSGGRQPAQPTIRTENTGQQVNVSSGDNSPVNITINAMPPE